MYAAVKTEFRRITVAGERRMEKNGK